MDDPIPIALEAGSRLAFGLGMEAAPALCRVAGVWRAQHDHCGTVSKPLRIAIGLTNARGIICKSRDSEDFGKPRHHHGGCFRDAEIGSRKGGSAQRGRSEAGRSEEHTSELPSQMRN